MDCFIDLDPIPSPVDVILPLEDVVVEPKDIDGIIVGTFVCSVCSRSNKLLHMSIFIFNTLTNKSCLSQRKFNYPQTTNPSLLYNHRSNPSSPLVGSNSQAPKPPIPSLTFVNAFHLSIRSFSGSPLPMLLWAPPRPDLTLWAPIGLGGMHQTLLPTKRTICPPR